VDDEGNTTIHHVAAPFFGHGISPFQEGTESFDLIMNHSAPDGMTAQLLLMEAYDIDYGLFPHGEVDGPDGIMSVVGAHDAEMLYGESKMYALMDELVSCRIPEMTNTSVHTLLEWPKYVLDRMIKRYRPGAQKDAQTAEELKRAIAEAQRNGKQ
jgi:hypothetical protein